MKYTIEHQHTFPAVDKLVKAQTDFFDAVTELISGKPAPKEETTEQKNSSQFLTE